MILENKTYKDFFSKETMDRLRSKSAQSFRDLLGGRRTNNTFILLNKLMKAEEPDRKELELLAKVLVTEHYGIVDDNNVEIIGKLGPMAPLQGDPDPSDANFDQVDLEVATKRRIINAITQGGSVRGAYLFNFFREYIDQINPTVGDSYGELLNSVFGIYDDDNNIALLLSAVASGAPSAGGQSNAYYDEEKQKWVVNAHGLVFPILVHEIIKGLYEILAYEGFTYGDDQANKVISSVDRLENEPEDLRYGKFIYDAIVALVYENTDSTDGRIRDYFITEIYKLPDEEFKVFIENLINEKLTRSQSNWARRQIQDIESDLKKDATNLKGLDYNPDTDGMDDDDVYV